jgi:signal transduction histidine kinase
MSPISVLWPMIAATSLTLGMVHLMVWWQNREKPERLWFFFMTVATAWMAFNELAMMKSQTPGEFGTALRWLHVPTWLNFLAITGFVLVQLRAGRRWIAFSIIGLRTVTLVMNFAIHPNINFREITGLRQVPYLGEMVSVAIGRPNPLMAVAQLALILLLAFVVDAAIKVWRQGDQKRALLTGGSIAFFISMGTINAVLSHWKIVEIPVCGSLYFLGMILVMAFDLSLETKRAANLEVELKDTRDSRQKEVAHLGRVAAFGEMSVSLAHEMNQPLGIILSNAQAAQKLLAKESPDLHEVRHILGDIVSEDLRASESIKRMRALLQRGEVSRQSLGLNDVATEVFHLMKNELARRDVCLTHDLENNLPVVSADRIQLQQVLLNLMLNSCEAMDSKPTNERQLHVRTTSDGKSVSLEVSDTGHGLPADVEMIFHPFHTTKQDGLGMGLAICRSIITANHGQLWAQPNQQSGGATFLVVLPGTEGVA